MTRSILWINSSAPLSPFSSACTGLPRQDLEWLFQFKGVTPEGAMATLATMQPTSQFGELFQYSNLLAGAGGFVPVPSRLARRDRQSARRPPARFRARVGV